MAATSLHRRRLLIVVVTLVAVALVAAGVYFFVPATGFSREALHYSVARAADRGIFGPTACERHAKGGWSCSLTTNGSDEIIYRVEMDGSRCWHGRRVALTHLRKNSTGA